jgi:hypothetical protein
MSQRYRGGNRLLDALPDAEWARLLDMIDVVQLSSGQITQEPEKNPHHVYFPINCMISIVATVMDGGRCEVGFVGNEGASGVEGAFGAEVLRESICQVPGQSARLNISDFLNETARHSSLDMLIRSTERARTFAVEQMIICNTLHTVKERLARWLLLMADRTEREEYPVTQEFLSVMLGVRRASITGAALRLQRAGIITYRRGHVMIPDRTALETQSCECYREVTSTFHHSLSVLKTASNGVRV